MKIILLLHVQEVLTLRIMFPYSYCMDFRKMPRKKTCSVLNCFNDSLNNSICTFFKPKNDAVAQRWKNVNPNMFSDNLPSYICSMHFRESDIPLNNLGARRLVSAFIDPVHLKTRYFTLCYCMLKKPWTILYSNLHCKKDFLAYSICFESWVFFRKKNYFLYQNKARFLLFSY